MKKHVPGLLQIFIVLAAALLLLWSLRDTAERPSVGRGQSKVVYDEEGYAQKTAVFSVAATEDRIFLCHGQDGVISVFDYYGNYCYSIVTAREGNGSPELYCVNGDLTIIDKNQHVFMYDGTDLTQHYQIAGPEEGSALRASLRKERSMLVTLDGDKVLDRQGEIVLRVKSGEKETLRQLTSNSVLILAAIVAIVCVRAGKQKPEKDLVPVER